MDAVQQATEVRLVDVSTSGMRLSHEGTLPAVGAILELVFADHRIARGEVRWAEDSQIGLHVVPEIEEAALAENEPVAEPATPAALPELPKDQLARFMDLFEAAKLSGFSVVKLRVDADAIEMVVSTDPAR
ncbi:PilZ domain-containing protein [Croceicoccus naphthovorans]|uniref:PilZ domain-containing protein n=1 Tax=Croceicoccus naphthovorans TaxID=1348774 RepID=UPI001FDEED71|nr:PilZ domain-containing protein [Croceicoccus naphthovorans]